MDRTHPLDYVHQLPRRTVSEVEHRDSVEDKQILLHEPWHHYAYRMGYPDTVAAEVHVKWATETWQEYETRSVQRAHALESYFERQGIEAAEAAAATHTKQIQSQSLISSLMQRENAIRHEKLASIHTLYVDFEERQLNKMTHERQSVEADEVASRHAVVQLEAEAWRSLDIDFAEATQIVVDFLEARRRAQEEEAARLLEEQRRKAEELRQLEEARRREAEAAEKARREAEEEAKRAERKRREEERKNKAKAEREARAKQVRTDQDGTEEKPTSTPVTNTAPTATAAQPPSTPAKPSAAPSVTFAPIVVDSLATLFASTTACFKLNETDSVYIIRVSAKTAMVVAHNGSVMGGKRGPSCHLLGLSIESESAVSIASPKLHSPTAEDFFESRVELIGNVSTDSRCFTFNAEAKVNESLLLIPLDHGSVYGRYLVAFSRPGANSIPRELAALFVSHVLGHIAAPLQTLLDKQHATILGQQALDWLAVTTACKNCSFAISDRTNQVSQLTFVTTTPSQKFLIGTSFTREEEANTNKGLSFGLIDEAVKAGQPEVAHINDVLDKSTNKVNGNEIRFFGNPRKGSLLLCPVVRPGDSKVFGMLYADTLDDDKVFNKADEDIMLTTAALLAEMLDASVAASPPSQPLSIETELFGSNGSQSNDAASPIRFLKHIWLKVNHDISAITSSQLMELARYNNPPPIIPITVTATLLLALGSNPKNVEQWEDARKRVKASLLGKIVAFDPTNTSSRKKAFFTRAKKITKGYSAHDVFTRGSYPASCFFTWTFVTILLRKSSEAIRKEMKGSMDASNPSMSIPFELLGQGNDADDDEEPASGVSEMEEAGQEEAPGDVEDEA